jgi:hypothetical protein
MAHGGRPSLWIRAARVLAPFATLALLAAAVATGGCELMVTDSLPAFSCRPGNGTCPSNMACVRATGQCVPRASTCSVTSCPAGTDCDPDTLACVPGDSGPSSDDATMTGDEDAPVGGDAMEAGGVDAEAGGRDTGGDTIGPCRTLGCKCSGSADCDSQVCADQLTVTPQLYAAAHSANFCTQSCCTSADCPDGSVCFATAAGGSYCVIPAWLGDRTATLGAKTGGQACSGGGECRSGLCAGNACADTCCSANGGECATGTTCRFTAFPGSGFDTHTSANCGLSFGIRQNGSSCTFDSDCISNMCGAVGGVGTNTCHAPCRSTANCGGGTQACGYVLPNPSPSNDVVAACVAGGGTAPEGSSCNPSASTNNCFSGFCAQASSECTDVCAATGDCTKAGWRCRPELEPVQGGGSFSVLACGL